MKRLPGVVRKSACFGVCAVSVILVIAGCQAPKAPTGPPPPADQQAKADIARQVDEAVERRLREEREERDPKPNDCVLCGEPSSMHGQIMIHNNTDVHFTMTVQTHDTSEWESRDVHPGDGWTFTNILQGKRLITATRQQPKTTYVEGHCTVLGNTMHMMDLVADRGGTYHFTHMEVPRHMEAVSPESSPVHIARNASGKERPRPIHSRLEGGGLRDE